MEMYGMILENSSTLCCGGFRGSKFTGWIEEEYVWDETCESEVGEGKVRWEHRWTCGKASQVWSALWLLISWAVIGNVSLRTLETQSCLMHGTIAEIHISPQKHQMFTTEYNSMVLQKKKKKKKKGLNWYQKIFRSDVKSICEPLLTSQPLSIFSFVLTQRWCMLACQHLLNCKMVAGQEKGREKRDCRRWETKLWKKKRV